MSSNHTNPPAHPTAAVNVVPSQEPEVVPKISRVPIDIIVAITLLLLTIIGVATYTVSQNKKIAELTKGQSVAARQRMLSQQQAKLLYRVGIGYTEKNPIDMAESVRDLKKAHKLFDETLSAFSLGGETIGVDGKTPVEIQPVNGATLRGALAETEDVWRDYSRGLQTLLRTRLSKIDGDMITLSADVTRELDEPLLNSSSVFVAQLASSVEGQSTSLQRVQQFSIFASVLLVGWVAFRVIRNLKANGDRLERSLGEVSQTNWQLATTQAELAQNSTDLHTAYASLQGYSKQVEDASVALRVQQEESETIFSAVNEGLFLIGRDFRIGNQVSDEMFEIFEMDQLSGRSLVDLLRPLITERDIHSLESYLELQFDSSTSESQLDKYNPLQKIEITLDWDGGGFTTKNLGFDFQRVFTADDQVASVLVTVNDVTETVRLENELNRANESRERQTELILEIIESDPKELDVFLKKAESTLNDINDELEGSQITGDSQGEGQRGKKLVESIFGKVHNLKGNASLLSLQSVVDTASTVEEKLGNLRQRSTYRGDELLTALVELAYMRELLTEFEELRATTLSSFKSIRTAGAVQAARGRTGKLVAELQGLVDTIGQEMGKSATVCASGLDLKPLPANQFQHAKDLLIQMVRNSMVHGIETPNIRASRNKWQEGAIQVRSTIEDNSDNPLGEPCYTIAYRDDGAGLDPEAIGRRALDLELVTEKDLKKMENAEKSALIFDHGFSSVDNSNDHAGRGAGMGLVRKIVNSELSGKLRMTYEEGEYLEFTVFMPLKSKVLP